MQNKKTKLVLASLFLCLSFHIGMASSQEKNAPPLDYSQHILRNGLKVLLVEDYSLPLVSVVVAYNAGSMQDPPQKSGLAYLLENLMFQGSDNIGQMQHINFIHRIGGDLNAVTEEDKTIYSQTVPSNQLALVLWLESDRMNSLKIDASNVARIKKALTEEIVNRKTSYPYFESSLYFNKLLFPSEAYSHAVIGSEEDLRNITVDDVKTFYQTYYIPNNAVLCVAGDINRRKTLDLIQKYFESIPKGEDALPLPLSEFPVASAIAQTIESPLAPSPGFHLGYRLAAPYSRDYYPLVIIEYLLLRGNSSLLYRRLIKKERIALNFDGSIDKRKNLAALKIFVTSNNEAMSEQCLNAILSEINRLKTILTEEKEVIKAKNMFKADYLSRFATLEDRSIFLVETLLSQNTLDHLPEELDRYTKVTPSDIIGISNRYLTQERILLHVNIK